MDYDYSDTLNCEKYLSYSKYYAIVTKQITVKTAMIAILPITATFCFSRSYNLSILALSEYHDSRKIRA